MEFFDRKEEVIDLKLTQYGRYVLSKGKFKPTFYAFYDDDILYDTEYAVNTTGSQKEAEDRIKSTPRFKVQYAFEGAGRALEKYIKSEWLSDEQKLAKVSRIIGERNNYYSLPLPLGNSSLNTQYAPAWSVEFLRGQITGSADYLTGSHDLLRIPQLEIEVYYDTSIAEEGNVEPEGPQGPNAIPVETVQDISSFSLSELFEDGTYVKVKEDYLLLKIEEKNTPFNKENFEIEVYEILQTANSKQPKLKRLSFTDPKMIRFENTLYDPELKKEIQLDESNVEYFFDFRIDDEIEAPITSEAAPLPLPANEEELCID
jgi:hypothetical protein